MFMLNGYNVEFTLSARPIPLLVVLSGCEIALAFYFEIRYAIH
jgi:hypothetical protein